MSWTPWGVLVKSWFSLGSCPWGVLGPMLGLLGLFWVSLGLCPGQYPGSLGCPGPCWGSGGTEFRQHPGKCGPRCSWATPSAQEALENLKDRWYQADNPPADLLLTEEEFLSFLHPEHSRGMLRFMVKEIIRDLGEAGWGTGWGTLALAGKTGALSGTRLAPHVSPCSDQDGDKRLSLPEFISLPVGTVENQQGQDMDDSWVRDRRKEFEDLIDSNHDGVVTSEELEVRGALPVPTCELHHLGAEACVPRVYPCVGTEACMYPCVGTEACVPRVWAQRRVCPVCVGAEACTPCVGAEA